MGRLIGINWKIIVRLLGLLLFIEALFMTVPLVTSLYYGEHDAMAFAATIVLTVVMGSLMAFGMRTRRSDMGKREGFLLTSLVWVVFSLFGMVPFLLSDTPMSVPDAFFEAMSGFTTTGATVIADTGEVSYGLFMWRAMMQWIGGLGIILFTLAVLPMLNSSGGMQMFNAEATGIVHEKLTPRVSSTAKRLWIVYIVLTLVLIALYWLGPMGTFDSVCHAFSTMSTGGFSTKAESIGAWDSLYVKIVTTVFMFIGGVNFGLIFKCSTGDFRSLWRSQAFRVYVLAIAAMFAVFDATLFFNENIPHTIEKFTIDPLFQIISIMSSTCYMMADFDQWGLFLLALVLIMMFFGACAGSTSGGAKLDRAVFLFKNTRNELYRCIYPNHILSVSTNGKTASPELINKVMVFLGLYVMVIIAGTLVLACCDIPLIDSFYSSLSCVTNANFSATVTDFTSSYTHIPTLCKWVMSGLMLTGRLEVFTVLVILTPTFWNK